VANIQPLSGSPANYAVYRGLLEKGDKIMSLVLAHGGHLTHGAPVSLSGMDYQIVHYALDEKTEVLDYQKIKELALKEKPRLIICGYSAYPRKIDFQKFKEVADSCGAYLMADIAHIAGLVAAKAHPSPFPWADVVTFTTHKTLRGPRGAVLICRAELKDKIFSKVFPGMQGGPHNHTIAAIALALKEASKPAFKAYINQVVKNTKALAEALGKYDFRLVSGGTDNHLILVNLIGKGVWGQEAQELLEKSGLVLNKNMIPYDARTPKDPSGIRLGTAAVTSRGMKEKEMKIIANLINQVVAKEAKPEEIRKQVEKLVLKFPLP
jgi:glycine hydroxymethyltransferase